ncbi:acyl-CoA dehydrogenase/oxidase [Aspergillus unguis]
MTSFVDKLQPAPGSDGAVALARERTQSNVSEVELARHLFGGSGWLERQARILAVMEREPLFSKGNQQNLSRPDRYKLALMRAKRLRQLTDELGWDEQDWDMARYLVDDILPFDLHLAMFVTTLRQQANDEQQANWLALAEQCKIIGAYAQTELGHGSNVQGIETVAIWDPSTREFILHSPHLTASKWWIGGLGRTATHAAVVANLLLPSKSNDTAGGAKYTRYGPHVFVTRIRDAETHLPLKGIAIGDIGPKVGYAGMDNGYMLFDHYRVPHSAMLSRFSRVNPDTGEYQKASNPAVVYGSLTYARSRIVQSTSLILARAVTIAVRYTAVRKQFADRDAPPENRMELAVLDYPTVQIRILPLLATAFALHYTGKIMYDAYCNLVKDGPGGSSQSLSTIHGTSSGLKSFCTEITANGLEICRRATGGHGFSAASGFVQLQSDYASKPTVEGDNWMLSQQCSAYLIKRATAVLADPNKEGYDSLGKSLQNFLLSKQPSSLDILHDDNDLVKAFQRRTAFLVFEAHKERIIKKRGWNTLLIELHNLSNAHSQAILVENFYLSLDSDNSVPAPTKHILRQLFKLFSFYLMDQTALDFVRASAASLEQVKALPGVIQTLMSEIRHHAVTIVDGFKIPDYLLNSSLGRYDGKVYEDLFQRAHRENPLNQTTFNPKYWENEIARDSQDWRMLTGKLQKL